MGAHGASAKSAKSAKSASGLALLSPGMRRPEASGRKPDADCADGADCAEAACGPELLSRGQDSLMRVLRYPRLHLRRRAESARCCLDHAGELGRVKPPAA